MSIIDRFFVALGFQVDPRGLQQVRQNVASARESLLSLGNAVRFGLAGAGIGGAIVGVAKLGMEFENNRIAIAGLLSALGISSDFNKGLEDAKASMESINTAAAKLPGEADEYIEVFRAGIPVIKGAMKGASLAEMTDFTNNFTALGKTLKVDAPQIGRDLGLMLGPVGRAAATTLTFMKLMPFLRLLPKQANLTAQSFNALTQPERMKLLKDVLANPEVVAMIEAMSSSFDAMIGAAKSAFKAIARISTEKLFEHMKNALDKVTKAFMGADGELTQLGRTVADSVDKVVGWGARIVRAFGDVISKLSEFKLVVQLAKAAALALFAVLLGPAIMLGLAIALIVEDVHGFFNNADSLTGLIVSKLTPALTELKIALITLGAILIGPTILAGYRAFSIFALAPKLLAATMFKAGVAAVAAAAKAAVAWLVAMGPLALTILALAAIGVAAYLLWENWDEIVQGMKKSWHDFIEDLKNAPKTIRVALGFGTPEENAAAGATRAAIIEANNSVGGGGNITAPGADVIWTNPATGLQETHKAGWRPPTATMSGAAAMSGATSVNSSTSSVHIEHLNIKSTDPQGAAKETRRELDKVGKRLIRNEQTQVKG